MVKLNIFNINIFIGIYTKKIYKNFKKLNFFSQYTKKIKKEIMEKNKCII